MTEHQPDDRESSPAAPNRGAHSPFLLDTPVVPLLLAALRTRRRITFVLSDRATLGNRYGLTDLEENVVFLDEANTLGEMHATIVHEFTHLIYPTLSEEEVEALAAELLVPLAVALEAHERDSIDETAEQLVVDGRLIRARLRAADASPPAEVDRAS